VRLLTTFYFIFSKADLCTHCAQFKGFWTERAAGGVRVSPNLLLDNGARFFCGRKDRRRAETARLWERPRTKSQLREASDPRAKHRASSSNGIFGMSGERLWSLVEGPRRGCQLSAFQFAKPKGRASSNGIFFLGGAFTIGQAAQRAPQKKHGPGPRGRRDLVQVHEQVVFRGGPAGVRWHRHTCIQ
jgi:hypothetical protein